MDLCLLEELPNLMELGIHSFKVEGRMKGLLYLTSVVRVYRQAIDSGWNSPHSFQVEQTWQQDLEGISHRPYTKGFLFPASKESSRVANSISYLQTHTFAGVVRSSPLDPLGELDPGHEAPEERIFVEVRSRLQTGMTLEFIYPDGSTRQYYLASLEDIRGNRITQAHPNTWVRLEVPFPTFPLQVIRMMRS
jgi:putative protease